MVLQVEAESICALTIFDFPSWTRCKWAKNFFAGLRVSLHSASSSASSSTKFDCCLLPTCFLVPPLHARAKWPTIPHLLHLLPNAGHWCWRGLGWLRDTKNTVALVEQKYDSHVWICSWHLLAPSGCFRRFSLTDSQKYSPQSFLRFQQLPATWPWFVRHLGICGLYRLVWHAGFQPLGRR